MCKGGGILESDLPTHFQAWVAQLYLLKYKMYFQVFEVTVEYFYHSVLPFYFSNIILS